MWNKQGEDNQDHHEEPEPEVTLFVPVSGPRKNFPADSYIGGRLLIIENVPTCSNCHQPMYLLVQLRIPNIHKTMMDSPSTSSTKADIVD